MREVAEALAFGGWRLGKISGDEYPNHGALADSMCRNKGKNAGGNNRIVLTENPEITTVSKPNRKPASAAVSDQKKMRRFIGGDATNGTSH